MRSDGSLVTGGYEFFGSFYTCSITCAPKGPGFVDFAAGDDVGGLAVRTDGRLLAWGTDRFVFSVAENTPTGRGFEAVERGRSMAMRSLPSPSRQPGR